MQARLGAVVLICSVVAGCSSPEPTIARVAQQPNERATSQSEMPLRAKLSAVTPVFDSFALALDAIRSKYPEMTGYKKEEAKGQFEDGMWCGHSHNFTRPTAKMGVLSSDFGEHGFTVGLSCKAMPPPGRAYAMSDPALRLNHLRLYVWTGIQTAPNPSPGLRDEVATIIQAHIAKLEAVDEAASNRTDAGDGT